MDLNSSFDSTASSVSLSCCQSLCDLLRELPLPKPIHNSNHKLINNNSNQNILENIELSHGLENALIYAKQQLNDLVFDDLIFDSNINQSMSPLVMNLSLKGVFNSNHFENNSLETIEPSIETHLEFNQNLELIQELNENNLNDVELDDNYSSLGDRVKQRQRQQMTQQSNNTFVRQQPQQQQQQQQQQDISNCLIAEKKTSSKTSRNDVKDIVLNFEYILNEIMEENENEFIENNENNSGFDLKIELKELKELMSLSSKLKHSNRMKELETKLSSKLYSFLSLLTNQMIVWFSKFKTQEMNEDLTQDNNYFWQLLINASKMSLNIMTSKNMSSRVVLFEELLEIIINFLVSFILNIIIIY